LGKSLTQTSGRWLTPGFLIYDFWTYRKSSIFGGSGRLWAAGKPSKKVGREAPPTFFGRFPGRPGPPRPPKSTISGRSKNHKKRRCSTGGAPAPRSAVQHRVARPGLVAGRARARVGRGSGKAGDEVHNRPCQLNVAAPWEEISNFLRVGDRSFWGSGRPRGPRWPFRWARGPRPHLFEGSPGPPGPPRLPK